MTHALRHLQTQYSLSLSKDPTNWMNSFLSGTQSVLIDSKLAFAA
jgi:hypothetical protein